MKIAKKNVLYRLIVNKLRVDFTLYNETYLPVTEFHTSGMQIVDYDECGD